MPNLTLLLLGAPHLVIDGVKHRLQSREAGLLAYLNDHPSAPIRREYLAELFWPSADSQRGLRSLSQLSYQLKKKSESLPLHSSRDTISMDALDSDVQQMAGAVQRGDYQRAADFYQGAFLLNAFQHSPDLELWRESKHQLILAMLDSALSRWMCDSPDAATQLQAVTRRLLGSGLSTATLLIAHTVSCLRHGEQQQAESAYQQLIRDHDVSVSLDVLNQIAGTSGGKLTDRSETITRSVRFVGRERELNSLQALWTSASAGNGALVVLTGEPGIGKSRLCDQLMRRVALTGGSVWSARCMYATRGLPYSAVLELVEDKLIHGESQPMSLAGGSSVSIASYNPLQPYQLFHALTDALQLKQTSQPVLVVVDDVQWADDFSIQLVMLWALRIKNWSVMLILVARTQDPDDAPEWVSFDLPNATRLSLGQLSIESAGELVRAFEHRNNVTLAPEIRDQVMWQSAGRPLLTLEGLAAAVHDDGGAAPQTVYLPDSAEGMLKRRFRNLHHDAMWIAGVVAVWGHSSPLATIVKLAELGDRATAAAIEHLVSRGVLEQTGAEIDYPHDLMREVAYRQLAVSTRMLLHRRVAEHLAQTDSDPGTVSHHFAAAGEGTTAARFGIHAARLATDKSLRSDSEYYYNLVMQHGNCEQKEIAALELSRHLVQAGRLTEVGAFLTHMKSPEHSDEVALLQRLCDLGFSLKSGTTPAKALMEAAKSISEIAESFEAVELAPTLGVLVDLAYEAADPCLGNEIVRAFSNVVNESAPPVLRFYVETMQDLWAGVTVGYVDPLRRLDLRDLSDTSGLSASARALGLFARGTLSILAGKLTVSDTCLRDCLALARETGDLHRQSAAAANHAIVFTELGRYKDGRELLETSLGSLNVSHRLRAYGNLAILYLETDQLNLAVEAANALLRANESYAVSKYHNTAIAVIGLSLHGQSKGEVAREYYRRLRFTNSTAHHLEGDYGYTGQFVARELAAARGLDYALAWLDGLVAAPAGRERVCAMRLSCARADLLLSGHPDAAYRLARQIRDDAESIGAISLVNQSQRIIDGSRS